MSDSTSQESKPKRYRRPSSQVRHTHLMAYWSDKENDFMFNHPYGSGTKSDGHLLYGIFSMKPLTVDFKTSKCGHVYADKSFLEELEDRGYDTKTLKFSVQLKPGARVRTT